MKKLESPSPKDTLCQDWLKLDQWFWRRIFLNFANVFSLFRNYLPLEKGRALHLNKLESPLLKDALCQVWLKLAQWFWRRIIFFLILSPLGKVNLCCCKMKYLMFKMLKRLSPSPKDALCQVWLKLAQWFWRRRWKCEKFRDRRTDRQADGQTDRQTTDDRWSEKLTWAFSSGELKIITTVFQLFRFSTVAYWIDPTLVIIVFARSQFTDSMILALMRMNLNPPLLSKGRFTLVAVEFLRFFPITLWSWALDILLALFISPILIIVNISPLKANSNLFYSLDYC